MDSIERSWATTEAVAFEEGYCNGIQGALIHLMGLLSWDILKVILEAEANKNGYKIVKI